MATKHRYIDIEIPEKLDADQRLVVAEEILEFIRSRTESGLDKRNKPFAPLTKEYKKYKQAVGAGGKADLTLTGDMLISLDLLKDDVGKIRIGFERGSEENAKADGHISGYVRRKQRGKKERDFLGIYKKDVQKILRELKQNGEI